MRLGQAWVVAISAYTELAALDLKFLGFVLRKFPEIIPRDPRLSNTSRYLGLLGSTLCISVPLEKLCSKINECIGPQCLLISTKKLSSGGCEKNTKSASQISRTRFGCFQWAFQSMSLFLEQYLNGKGKGKNGKTSEKERKNIVKGKATVP